MASDAHLVLNAVAAWPGFVADMEFDLLPAELTEQFCQGRWRIADLSMLADLRALAILCHCNRNGRLVNIQADVLY